MIRYDLTCDNGHAFDAWFASSESYDDQERRGFLSCAHCGSPNVAKAIMAPSVAKGRGASGANSDSGGRDSLELAHGMSADMRRTLRELRARIMKDSVDVGGRFADEARAIHRGERPGRSVHGYATAEEAQAMVEEGLAIAPLPPDPGGH